MHLQHLSHGKTKNELRKIAEDEAKPIFVEERGTSMLKVAEGDLQEIFFDGFKETSNGFKNDLYSFTKGVCLEVASKRSSDNMFKRNVECRKQLSLFKNTFTQRALNSPHFCNR